MNRIKLLLAMGVCLGLTALALAQFDFPRSRRSRSDTGQNFRMDRNGVPDWDLDAEFPRDVFTFVRIRYGSDGRRGWGSWLTDYPDSDLNLSYRLQQLTSLKVNPDPIILELTDPRLFDYPFVYFCEPGGGRGGRGAGLDFTDEEIECFRRYLLQGGFAMFDDFWGEAEWDVFYEQIKRVFPDREPEELPLEHPIFHCVYDLKEKPQVPAINTALRGRGAGPDGTDITWERYDAQEVHYRGLFDDHGRLMALICHNTDLGDGWEREGESEWYFREFSEKKSYPLGINIVFYVMTH